MLYQGIIKLGSLSSSNKCTFESSIFIFLSSIFLLKLGLVHKRIYLNGESMFTNSRIDRLIPTPVEMRMYFVHYRF